MIDLALYRITGNKSHEAIVARGNRIIAVFGPEPDNDAHMKSAKDYLTAARWQGYHIELVHSWRRSNA